MWLFYYFDFKKNYDVLNSKSPCILLNENINFNKNKTESKMENPKHRFRYTNLALQLIKESQIKSKTVMSWSSGRKKRRFFVPFIFTEERFFNISVLSECTVY